MSETGAALDDLLARLRTSVAQRRASGQYPPDLEEDLDAHFERIISSRTQMPRLATLRRRIELVRRASRFSADRIPTSTRLPGGAVLHKAMSRVFLRQAHGILLQVQEFADRTIEALEAVSALADSPDSHQHVDLIERLDTHTEALAAASRVVESGPHSGPESGPPSLSDYARRLEALERAEANRRWRPWFGRDRFEAAFDQGRRDRLSEATAAAIGDRAPVVDVSTLGGDDPLDALAAHGDGSLGAVVAVRADEVLTAQQVVDLVAVAFERLLADGRLIVSSGAPPEYGALPEDGAPPEDAAPRPAFNPTLGPSLPGRYVAFVCREAGFAGVELQDWSGDGYLVVATR